jgi:hypothetical protein
MYLFRKVIPAALCVLFFNTFYGQGVVISAAGGTPDPSSILDVQSTSAGLLLPRLTKTERDAITDPAAGLQIYNTTNDCLQIYTPLRGWTNIVCGSPPSSPTLICQDDYDIPAGPNHRDRGCVTFTYLGGRYTHTTVRAADGKEWLQQNLGSDRVAQSSTDALSYGHYFQWGRWDDGHQVPSSPSVETSGPLRPNNVAPGPDNSYYYHSNSANHWWGNGQVNDAWNGAYISQASTTRGVDPCKQALGGNWRLPTGGSTGELAGVWNAEGLTEGAGADVAAFNSSLALPLSGYRGPNTGGFVSLGDIGYLWSSSPFPTQGNNSRRLSFSSTGITPHNNGYFRGLGYPVRCIRD